MTVEIVYGDGKIGVFDTANLVAGQPFGRSCITAELVMRFDMADSEGVCLDIHHHDIAEEADDADVPFANRCRGYRVCLAEAGELDGIESIVVDDRVVAWRQAGRFVDGVRFERAQRLWYSDSPNAGDNYKACSIYDYLEAARPDLRSGPQAVGARCGYPVEAFVEARQAENAQPEEDEEV